MQAGLQVLVDVRQNTHGMPHTLIPLSWTRTPLTIVLSPAKCGCAASCRTLAQNLGGLGACSVSWCRAAMRCPAARKTAPRCDSPRAVLEVALYWTSSATSSPSLPPQLLPPLMLPSLLLPSLECLGAVVACRKQAARPTEDVRRCIHFMTTVVL